MNEEEKKQFILSTATSTEIVPLAVDNRLSLQEYKKIPLTQIAALGNSPLTVLFDNENIYLK